MSRGLVFIRNRSHSRRNRSRSRFRHRNPSRSRSRCRSLNMRMGNIIIGSHMRIFRHWVMPSSRTRILVASMFEAFLGCCDRRCIRVRMCSRLMCRNSMRVYLSVRNRIQRPLTYSYCCYTVYAF